MDLTLSQRWKITKTDHALDLNPLSQGIAYVVLLFGCCCFGVMFLPLKRYDCADGFFVQFMQCSTVFVYGFVLNYIRNFPQFNLIASLGGALYATGNLVSVPIITSELTLAVGFLIWTTVQIVEGWAIGRFGLFGVHANNVKSEALNITGLVLTIISGFIFMFVRNDKKLVITAKSDKSVNRFGFQKFISKNKLFYIVLSIFLGVVHGLMLTPVVYLQDNDVNYTGNVLDYIFSFFCGVFVCSTVYFAIYAVIKRNQPILQSELVLPSFVYGILWATGMTSFIVANSILSQTVSWPITARLPAIIGCLLDVFGFQSIKGKQNFIILATGITVGIVGVVMVALSN